MRYIPKFQKGANIRKEINEKQANTIANKIKNKQPISEKERQDYDNVYHKLASKGVDDKGEEYLNANLPEVEVTAKRTPYTQGLPTPYKLMSGYADMAGQVMNTPAAAMGELAHAVSGKDGEMSRIIPQHLNPYSKHWQGDKGTPEQRSVSDAANIQNPVGRFAVDLLTDPTTWTGAGVVKNARFKNNIKKAADEYINVINDPRTLERAKNLDLEHGTKYTEQIPNWLKNKHLQNSQTGLYNIKLKNNIGGVAYSDINKESVSKKLNRQIPDIHSRIHTDANYNKISHTLFNQPLDKESQSYGDILRFANKQYQKNSAKRNALKNQLELDNREIVFNKPIRHGKYIANMVTSHELKHDLTGANDLITNSQIREMRNFSHSYDDIVKKYGDAKAGYYGDPTEIDAFLSTSVRKSMIDKGILKDHFDLLTPEKLNEFKKTKEGIDFEPLNAVVKDESKYIDWFNKALPAAGTGVIASEALKDKKQLGGSISKLGYKNNSPYKNEKQLNIHSPNGSLTMDNVDKDLLVTDKSNGEQRVLKANSGLHQFEGTDFIEQPINKSYNNMLPKPTIDKDLWKESVNKAKTKLSNPLPDELYMYGKRDITKNNRNAMMMQTGGDIARKAAILEKTKAEEAQNTPLKDQVYVADLPEYEVSATRLAPGTTAKMEKEKAKSMKSKPSLSPALLKGSNNLKQGAKQAGVSTQEQFTNIAQNEFTKDDKYNKQSNRQVSTENIDYDDEIFQRDQNTKLLPKYPNAEKTKVFTDKTNTEFEGAGTTNLKSNSYTAGGDRKGVVTAPTSKTSTGNNVMLQNDLREFGYSDDNGALTDKALGLLPPEARAYAKANLTVKEINDLGGRGKEDGDTPEMIRKKNLATQIMNASGNTSKNKASVQTAMQKPGDFDRFAGQYNEKWKGLSNAQKQEYYGDHEKFYNEFGSDISRYVENLKRGKSSEVSRVAKATSVANTDDVDKNRFETSGNVNKKPNGTIKTEQGGRYKLYDYKPGSKGVPETSKPKPKTGVGQSKGKPNTVPLRKESKPRPSLTEESRGAVKNKAVMQSPGEKKTDLIEKDLKLKANTHDRKVETIRDRLVPKKQMGGYINSFDMQMQIDKIKSNFDLSRNSNTNPYSVGSVVKYRDGGEIKNGVVKSYDPKSGRVELY